jgi:hypothetical protein
LQAVEKLPGKARVVLIIQLASCIGLIILGGALVLLGGLLSLVSVQSGPHGTLGPYALWMGVTFLLLGAGLIVAGVLGIKARSRYKTWYRGAKRGRI